MLGDPRLPAALAKRLAASGGRLVIVHGAADEVSALQRTFGVKPAFVNGLRVTSPDDINTIRMACSGLANKRLIAALIGVGIRAVGLSGEDASILVAEPAGDGALGAIGNVVSVHTPLLELLLANGYVPAISPLARAARAAGLPAAVQVFKGHRRRPQPVASAAASDVFPAPERPSTATTRVPPARGAALASAATMRVSPSPAVSASLTRPPAP